MDVKRFAILHSVLLKPSIMLPDISSEQDILAHYGLIYFHIL
jgi:hypothetical protein